MADPEILTAREVAVLLGVGDNTVYKAAREGRLPALRLGRRLLFHREAVLEAVRRARASPPEG